MDLGQLMILTVVFIVVVIVLVNIQSFLKNTIIYEYEQGLKYTNGKFLGLLASGRYWYLPFRTEIRKIDTRMQSMAMTGQDLLTADGIGFKISLAANYKLVDPVVAVNQIGDYKAALQLALQVGLREVIGASTASDLLNKKINCGSLVMELAQKKAQALGLELVSIDVKDILSVG